MDAETQIEESVPYDIVELHRDLRNTDEPVGISLKVETHQYPSHFERYVTQSDFGFVISYQNQFNSEKSSTVSWLMQAKRVFPSSEGIYNGHSKYSSLDIEQRKRIELLRDWADEDFIRYLLYCPRPSALEPHVREKLNYNRATSLSGRIFDYSLGLELRDDLIYRFPTSE